MKGTLHFSARNVSPFSRAPFSGEPTTEPLSAFAAVYHLGTNRIKHTHSLTHSLFRSLLVNEQL